MSNLFALLLQNSMLTSSGTALPGGLLEYVKYLAVGWSMLLASQRLWDAEQSTCAVVGSMPEQVTNIRSIVGGVSAAVSKTAAAPIERIKLLVQNQVRLLAGACL